MIKINNFAIMSMIDGQFRVFSTTPKNAGKHRLRWRRTHSGWYDSAVQLCGYSEQIPTTLMTPATVVGQP